MSITKTKTISLYELETTYSGDILNLHDQFEDEFRIEHPEKIIIGTDGESFLDEDLLEITYVITITF